jgi:hypothetical protein
VQFICLFAFIRCRRPEFPIYFLNFHHSQENKQNENCWNARMNFSGSRAIWYNGVSRIEEDSEVPGTFKVPGT